MKIKYLIEKIRNISGYKEKTSSRVNSNKLIINDNLIFSAINEAQKFICADLAPEAFKVPLNVDLRTDILGSDLLRPKLSSYNEGSKVDYLSSTMLGSEKLPMPNSQKICKILEITQSRSDVFSPSYGINFTMVNSQEEYLAGSSMGLIGEVLINKYKSETLQCEHLSTFKTSFTAKDKNGRIVGTYTVTTETNVYAFDINGIRISINYEDKLITFNYTGRDADNYTIEVSTLYQPSNIVYFNKGNIRVSNNFVINNLSNFSIRISPYNVWDPTQEICSIYDEDLIEYLANVAAVEVQRANRSIDQNLINIVSNKTKKYQVRERFKKSGSRNDIKYPSNKLF